MPGKYLVTGGCGFIGSNLVKRLAKDGNGVVIIDNLSTGREENVDGGKFRILKSISEVRELDEDFDGIFHFGMPSSTPIYRDDRSIIGKTVTEIITLLEYAREKKLKIVFASSSSVYNRNKPPFREDMPIIPTDFYTETRLFIERICRVYYEFYGVKSIALRLFSVYGENEQSKGRFANLVSQIEWTRDKGETFDVYNEGKAVRDMIHVSDVVEAFILAMNSDIDYDIINIGTGKACTINDIIKATGLKNYKYVKNPIKNYVDETLADTSKAEKVLGFRAKIDVMDYIRGRTSARPDLERLDNVGRREE